MYLKIIQLYIFHLVIAYYFLDTGSYQLSPGIRFLRAPNLFGQASPFIIASTKDYIDYRKFKIIIMVLLEPRLPLYKHIRIQGLFQDFFTFFKDFSLAKLKRISQSWNRWIRRKCLNLVCAGVKRLHQKKSPGLISLFSRILFKY